MFPATFPQKSLNGTTPATSVRATPVLMLGATFFVQREINADDVGLRSRAQG